MSYYIRLLRHFITSIIFLLLVQSVQAQPTEYVEKPRKIKMPKYFMTDIPKKSIPFTGIRVIQAVWDSTRLGFIQKGMMNMKAEAIPTKDLSVFLQDYVDHQYEDFYKKTGSQLLFLVKEMRINERTAFSTEIAFCKLSIDAWISADGAMFKKVATTDTVITYSSMSDVSSLHGENIARGIYKLVLASLKNAADNNYLSGEITMTPDAINQEARQRFQQPILTEKNLVEGAYMSFDEFINNRPSLADFTISSIEKKKVKIETTGEAKKEIQPWGICKSGEIYKYYEQQLIPIEKNNDGFVISDYIERGNRRNSGIFVAGLFGGLAGGVVAGSSNKMIPVTNLPHLKKQPEASAIDMKTGEFTF